MRHTHRYHAAVAAIAVITLIVLLIPAHLISFAEGEGGLSANIAGAAESQSQMSEYDPFKQTTGPFEPQAQNAASVGRQIGRASCRERV